MSFEELAVLDDVGVGMDHVDVEAKSLEQQVLVRHQHLGTLDVLLRPGEKFFAFMKRASI